jgi:hypothetical protein
MMRIIYINKTLLLFTMIEIYTFQAAIIKGKFHGIINPATPTGSFLTLIPTSFGPISIVCSLRTPDKICVA